MSYKNHFMIYAALTCYAFLVDFYGPQTKKGKPLSIRIYESKITKCIGVSERERERERERELSCITLRVAYVLICYVNKYITRWDELFSQLLLGHNVKRRKYRTQGMTFLKHSCTLSRVHRRIYIFSTLKVWVGMFLSCTRS